MKVGVIEKFKDEKVQVTLKATYQLLSDEKAREIQNDPGFMDHPEQRAGGLFKSDSAALSESNTALVGTEQFQVGHKILVTFEVQAAQTSITCLAEVKWVQQFMEMKRPMHRAGLKFLSMKKDDVYRLNDILKGRGAK